MSQLAITLPQIRITSVGADCPENISRDEWLQIWDKCSQIDAAFNWIKGDLLNVSTRFVASEAMSDDDKQDKAIAELLRVDSETRRRLRNLAWVASRIPMSRRRDTLSWSHHYEVASLSPADQTILLDAALANGWSRADLREQVFKHRHPESAEPSGPIFSFSPVSMQNQFLRWAGRLEEWPEPRRIALVKQMRPLLEWLKPLMEML
jgi:hypothetical protein